MNRIMEIIFMIAPILGVLSFIYVIYLSIFQHLPFTLENSIYPKLKPSYLKVEKTAYLLWSILCIGITLCDNFFQISYALSQLEIDILPQLIIYALIGLAIGVYVYRVQARRKLNKIGDKLREEEKYLRR